MGVTRVGWAGPCEWPPQSPPRTEGLGSIHSLRQPKRAAGVPPSGRLSIFSSLRPPRLCRRADTLPAGKTVPGPPGMPCARVPTFSHQPSTPVRGLLCQQV